MIILPAIIALLIEGAVIGGLASAVICGMEDRRNLPSDAPKSQRTAHKCAAEGALVGGLFGAGVGSAFAGVGGLVDDIAKPMANVADDALKPAIATLDDIAKPATQGLRRLHKLIAKHRQALSKGEANMTRARFHEWLPKGAGNHGYVYIMDDLSAPGRYKIGKTIAPSRRLREIAKKTKARYFCVIPTANMHVLEASLHARIAASRLADIGAGTEFFYLKAGQLNAACNA